MQQPPHQYAEQNQHAHVNRPNREFVCMHPHVTEIVEEELSKPQAVDGGLKVAIATDLKNIPNLPLISLIGF